LWQIPQMRKANYSREELAALLGLRTQTLAAWACRNRGPRFWKRKHRALYRAADVAAWLDDPAAYDAARSSTPTSTSRSTSRSR
jgi:transcriptional regulator with XRE-family HTH domain